MPFHYSNFFGSRNIDFFVNHMLSFKCLVKTMSYVKVDCSHLNADAKRLITYFICVIILEIEKGSWKFLHTSKSLMDEIPEI